jgi:probable phosphoglycerate mutase
MNPKEKQEHSYEKRPTVLILVRHATNDWVKTGKLAGRTPGVHLNEHGMKQAKALGERLANREIKAIYSSPLERAVETATAIAKHHNLPILECVAMGEVDFGDWAGRELKELAKEPEWPLVQGRPSAMRFPNGESPREMLDRAINGLESVAASHPEEITVLVSHSDVIKAILAHYLGLHLDLFQRLMISPASISVLAFTPMGGRVVCINDTAHNPEIPRDD